MNSKGKSIEESIIDISAEHVKELEDELLKLGIENAFLKELRTLRLEDASIHIFYIKKSQLTQ